MGPVLLTGGSQERSPAAQKTRNTPSLRRRRFSRMLLQRTVTSLTPRIIAAQRIARAVDPASGEGSRQGYRAAEEQVSQKRDGVGDLQRSVVIGVSGLLTGQLRSSQEEAVEDEDG